MAGQRKRYSADFKAKVALEAIRGERSMSAGRRQEMVDRSHPGLSVVRQCALLSICRSLYYGSVRGKSAEKLALIRLIDAQFLETPWYGSWQMCSSNGSGGH
ncbi:hypothetical protein [Azospirillum sp. RU38E]|uniref:hypothetical protein n=1 Tax=unclassified Azospirillum TaxID=2630922 RepID=UPI000B71D276|nr:hypothetical protein SAMN05880556_12418 [Azospirillum sp. RU38E]SNT23874.1 hypothetical protein SAMN05880591_12318 [Azospirillum sp. RU37A]